MKLWVSPGFFGFKMHQKPFSVPRWGSLRRSPDTLVGWRGVTPSPLDAPSARRSWRITVKLFRPGWCVSLRSVMSERFTTSPQDVTAVPGQTVRLSCSIPAVPPAIISWMKDSLPLSRSPSDQHRYQPPQPFLLVALHFNGSFPVGPGLAGTRTSPFWIPVKLKMMEVVSGDNWSYKTCKAPVKSSSPTNQHPVSLQAG